MSSGNEKPKASHYQSSIDITHILLSSKQKQILPVGKTFKMYCGLQKNKSLEE